MPTSTPSPSADPHLDHLFKIQVLSKRAGSKATRKEAQAELLRYRDEGLADQQYRQEGQVAKKKTRAHEKAERRTFTGQGILFAVIDDREVMAPGRHSTVSIIADAIDKALDAGYETPDEIARYLTTSAFQHQPDKRVRFNSVLKAGDVVGAQMTSKLHNAYNELAELADEEEDTTAKAKIRAEATGFAEALNIVMSPFTCEYPDDPRLVNWDEVDRITETFEKEQRLVRRDRKGNPQ